MNTADNIILYNAYMRYRDICKNKFGSINDSRVMTLRGEINTNLNKCMLYVGSSKTTEVEKIRYANKLKNTYQQYCFGLKANKNFATENLTNKINEALKLLAAYEEERIKLFRTKHIIGDKIDLSPIFIEDSNIRQLISKMADKIVEEYFKNVDYTVSGEDEDAVYITANGSKYHKINCPFCKGRDMILSTKKEVENLKLSPCRCVNQITDKILEKDKLSPISYTEADYVTVFVDESIRKNAWRFLDETQPECHGVYSYLLCKGKLTSELQITTENLLYKHVDIIQNEYHTGIVTMDAISQILMKLLSMGLTEHVIIYTDNMEAKNNWLERKENKNLSKYFKSIKVQYIPREENTYADKLGRQRVFIDCSESFIKKIIIKCKGYDSLKTCLFQNEIDYEKEAGK